MSSPPPPPISKIRMWWKMKKDQLRKWYKNKTKKYHNIHYIPYFHDNKTYYYPLVIKHGIKPILEKAYGDDKDITKDMLKFFGPNCDFHNMKLKPKYFGCKVLKLVIDGEEKVFNSNENITI